MFVIEDQRHAETVGQFSTHEEAVAELRRLSEVAWDEAPNTAPCGGWRTCGRDYEIIQYDVTRTPWRELSRAEALEVSAAGIRWLP